MADCQVEWTSEQLCSQPAMERIPDGWKVLDCMDMKPARVLLLILLISCLFGCQGTGGYVPVADSGERVSSRSGQRVHVVRAGDTLYSIAWNYGLDYRDLARMNGITAPYTIFIKQRLKLSGATKSVQQKPASQSSKPTQAKSAKAPAPKAKPEKLSWSWPIQGKVVKGFALKGDVNKGVDIAGKNGLSVKSAASGTVVYAGGGLRGYGKLVILKHSANYLSAYGNNSEILVKEGDTVDRGKTIARLANAGGVEPQLHFEIRLDGKPQDPLKYLPRQ